MPSFSWFPIGYELPGGRAGKLVSQGAGYQIIRNQELGSVMLAVEADSYAASQVDICVAGNFDPFNFGDRKFLVRVFPEHDRPIVLRDWAKECGLPTSVDVARLGEAVRKLRNRCPGAEIGSSLFLYDVDECLPTRKGCEEDLLALAFRIAAAGAEMSSVDSDAIRSINSWLTQEEIFEFFDCFGINRDDLMGSDASPETSKAVDASAFALPGRPELEAFFREYILEPSADPERYSALGVKMPNGVLLYGPTGSGKSHAVEKLVKYLGWPVFEIDLGAVGSAFIHQTSVTLRKTFDQAKRRAPAIVVLEEIDALAGSRGPMTHDHKVEEVAELLRLVEKAGENRILVLATTNRIESLDPAIRRKGRFDHAIEVGYPTAPEVQAAIKSMLRGRPHREIPAIDRLAAALAGRSMSDTAWVVNEAARLAARSKKDAIEESDLVAAMRSLKIEMTSIN